MAEYYFENDMLKRRLSSSKKTDGIALFLDYDGTLVPIQKDPSRCILEGTLKEQLRVLAGSHSVYLTVLSGRSLNDIRKRVGIREICYGGNHGLDISGPGIRFTHCEATAARPLIARAKRILTRELRPFEGAWLEDKKYTLSLHFRGVKREDAHTVKRKFYKTVAAFPESGSFVVIRGKKVLELAPGPQWNKGRAALLILGRLGDKCLPVVVGDDLTDETAFEALREKGLTVRVGRSRKTSAQYFVRNQAEVAGILAHIMDMVGNF